MIEEQSKLPVEAPHDRYGEGLLYDYAKFITTLSMLALGGVLSLTPAIGRGEFETTRVVMIIVAISTGGIIALSTANALVDARATGKEPSRWLPRYIKAAMASVGIGLGAFLYLWLDALQ
jgi:hypothetical protein